MRFPYALALAAVGFFSLEPATAAEKKPAGLRDFPFFAAPKNPHARGFVPGLQAALAITPAQAERIEAACRETIDKPEARTKNGTGAAAMEQLQAKVADILTKDQKALIEKMNDLYAKVAASVGEDFQADFVGAKGNPDEIARLRQKQREAVTEEYSKKLVGLLSEDQIKAVEKAAAKQKRLAEDKKSKVKPQ